MEMVSTTFYDNLEDLLSKKLVSMDDLNTKVANILRVKFKMNLFQNYYTDLSRQSIILCPEHKEAAKLQATQCPVLLQNKNYLKEAHTSMCITIVNTLNFKRTKWCRN